MDREIGIKIFINRMHFSRVHKGPQNNNLVLLAFTFIWLMGGVINSHALSSQDPEERHSMYPPYSYVLGNPIAVLPQEAITIRVGEETFYYYQGFFYQMVMRIQKYVVVPPPIGAVVFSIPPGYQLMMIGEKAVYEYQGVYYSRVLDGYKVIFPPG